MRTTWLTYLTTPGLFFEYQVARIYELICTDKIRNINTNEESHDGDYLNSLNFMSS